jgi:hypothetical protein
MEEVLSGGCHNAYALVRPPGHHAEAGEGMGFCIFNNIAIAAQAALEQHGLSRVAIVDYDVHHGRREGRGGACQSAALGLGLGCAGPAWRQAQRHAGKGGGGCAAAASSSPARATAASQLLPRKPRPAPPQLPAPAAGNGTQSIFEGDDRVLFISLHQDSNYPIGSGGLGERGTGAGEGYNINVPLPPGSGSGAYRWLPRAAAWLGAWSAAGGGRGLQAGWQQAAEDRRKGWGACRAGGGLLRRLAVPC